MNILELILIAIAVSMDAFAISIAKGLCNKKSNYKLALTLALFFGIFQALMPLIGFYLTNNFSEYIQSYNYLISFIILSFIGIKMIMDSFHIDNTCDTDNRIKYNEIIILSIATSIDALAVGITFSLLDNFNILFSVFLIGITTFIFSFIGVILGCKLGSKFENIAEIFGGSVLIILALRILTQHF
jgi:putative Mn2+ efflux pump MntP